MIEDIAKQLIKNGFVDHRINRKTKKEQVKISESGLIAIELLLRLKNE